MVLVKDFIHASQLFESFISSTKTPRYTLERMFSLMSYLDNPQDKLKVIHVAGTSGKTSTSYYAAALLKASGFKVGLTTSPHIDTIAERAQINLQLLPEKLYCKELGLFLDLVAQSGLQPSYFEALVAFSFWLFERQGVEYAVIEVGIGGLLDGTNVVHRNDKICIITDIGFDHTEILGTTLPEIAAQKAGIIHKGNYVFTHSQDPDILTVIRQTSEREGAELKIVGIDKELTKLRDFQSLPDFQQRNFSLAYGALQNILKKTAIESALAVYIPARMEEVKWSNKTIVLDGSHNEQKIASLVEAIKKKYPEKPIVLLVSFGENKTASLETNLRILRTISAHIILTHFYLGQDILRKSIDPISIASVAERLGFLAEIVDNPQKAFEYSLQQTEEIVLVTGSFYLLNHVRPAMQLGGLKH